MSTPKIQRILSRFQARIDEKQFYEAHQIFKTAVARESVTSQIELLSSGATILLKANQLGSGSDLIFQLLKVYDTVEVNDANVARLVAILGVFGSLEASSEHAVVLKDVVTGMNNWSIKNGSNKFGDSQLHHAIGVQLIKAGFGYEAERYLVLGTKDSLSVYLDLLSQWYKQGGSSVGQFLIRIALNYLFIGDIDSATRGTKKFLAEFATGEKLSKGAAEITLVQGDELASFAQLIIVACQTKNVKYFEMLKAHYNLSEYSGAMEFLGQEYFGVKVTKPVNFLQDMMSMFG